MKPLLKKELRLLRPYMVLMAALIVLDLFLTFLQSYPDQHDRASSSSTVFTSGMELLFAFFIVQGVSNREDEQHSIELLGGMPVSRAVIFLAKVIAVTCVLLSFEGADHVHTAAMRALRATSLDRSLGASYWARSYVLHAVQWLSFVGLAFLLASFRQLGWPLLAAVLALFSMFAEWLPSLTAVNVLTLTEEAFDGMTLLLPWPRIVAALGVAATGTLAAGFLSTRDPDTVGATLDRLRESKWVGALVVVVILTSLGIMLGISSPPAPTHDDPEAMAKGTSWTRAQAHTEHYLFSYPANEQAKADALVAAADSVYTRVETFLDAGVPQQIAVDLGGSRQGTLGTAAWTSVHVDLAAHKDLEDQKLTLAHETTHVLISVLSDRRLDRMGDARWFHEGLATYVHLHTYADDTKKSAARFTAAVLHARRQATFELLADSAKLDREYDSDSAYPLGAEMIGALVDVYGKAAPMKIVKALAEHTELRDVTGTAFWRPAFAAAGYELEKVVGRYERTLANEKKTQQARIDTLPSVAATLHHWPDYYYVVLDEPLPKGFELRCRFRKRPGEEPIFGTAVGGRACWVWAGHFVDRTLWFQAGVHSPKETWTIFSPWTEAQRAGAPELDRGLFAELQLADCLSGKGQECVSLAAQFKDQAVDYLRAGCERNHGPSCKRLGDALNDGAAFGKGCALRDAEACAALAACEEAGTCAEKDLAKAAEHWVFACDNGTLDACARAARAYEDGAGVPRDLSRAAELAEKGKRR